MHPNSLRIMESLFQRYAPDGAFNCMYDVGSYDINGNYRAIAVKHNWMYSGLDITPGPNVDTVISPVGEVKSSQHRKMYELPPCMLIISGQCIEHVNYPWEFVKEIERTLTPGGYFFLVAPFMWEQHRHPVDCWRFLPYGMRALADYTGLNFIDSGLSPTPERPIDNIDCWAVMQKPKLELKLCC